MNGRRMNSYILGLLCLYGILNMSDGRPRYKRMVDGERASLQEWPFVVWLVKINFNKTLGTNASGTIGYEYCGGTLIKKNWVVTAAHCVRDVLHNTDRLSVLIGSEDRHFMENIPKYQYNVSKIYIHSSYVTADVIPNDDIALIKLSRNVNNNQFSIVRPIPLSVWNIENGKKKQYHCNAAGWGKSRAYKNIADMKKTSEKPSKYLMKIDVPLMPRSDCLQQFNDTAYNGTTHNGTVIYNNGTGLLDEKMFWTKMMCGGRFDATLGTACLHDSGSPLVCEDMNGNRELSGITIAIHGPEIKQTPCTPGKQIIIFIRISYYASWILNIVENRQPSLFVTNR